MTKGLVVRSFETHEWRVYRALRLRALADSPDAFASTLSRERTLGDEHWSGRLRRGTQGGHDYPVLAEFGGDPVGLACSVPTTGRPLRNRLTPFGDA